MTNDITTAAALADVLDFNSRVKRTRLLMRDIGLPGLEIIFMLAAETFYAGIERAENEDYDAAA